jgi:thymidine kinase
MQKYVKVYCDYFDIKTENELICEACGKQANDIHHINGRGKEKDEINNLMALCRKCHERAHGGIHPLSKGEFQYIHNKFLLGNRKPLLK